MRPPYLAATLTQLRFDAPSNDAQIEDQCALSEMQAKAMLRALTAVLSVVGLFRFVHGRRKRRKPEMIRRKRIDETSECARCEGTLTRTSKSSNKREKFCPSIKRMLPSTRAKRCSSFFSPIFRIPILARAPKQRSKSCEQRVERRDRFNRFLWFCQRLLMHLDRC